MIIKKMQKNQPVLLEPVSHHAGLDEEDAESYSSNSSFTDSYSNGSDLANWEEYVADDGTLFYAEYVANATKSAGGTQMPLEKRLEFKRNSSSRHGNNKTRQSQTATQNEKCNNKQEHLQLQNKQQQLESDNFKFSHIKSAHENHCKKLELVITATDRFRFGRRSTAVESILGFRVVPFIDKPECLMLDSFVHDIPAMQQQQQQQQQQQNEISEEAIIKRGDWFKSLDDIDIRTSNVDELLLQFIEPTKVCLKFQGTNCGDSNTADDNDVNYGAGVTDFNKMLKIENFGMFAQTFKQLLLNQTNLSTPTDISISPFGMLILPPECFQYDQYKDSLYYYPDCTVSNFLYKARGSFLTLNTVLTEELQSKPLTSKLLIEQKQYFVNYRTLNGFLVLFAYTAQHQTMAECNLRSDELIAYMRFAFSKLKFENFINVNKSSAGLRQFLDHLCEIQRVRILSTVINKSCQFETLLKESRSMPLPKEAQLRIFDALSEMEAMDYRNWNDEPLSTHREFFIFGSVLFYKSHMLASQLPIEVCASVDGFLRCRGIFDFITTTTVRELYVWEEIVLPNSTGRYFLTVCSRNNLILAVILKIFEAPDTVPDMKIPPSLFYIEEIQETLDHLIQCGIESLAMFWSISNKRPEILDAVSLVDEIPAEKEIRKLETFLKQKLTVSNTSCSAASTSNTTQRNCDEDIQLGSSLGGSSIHSLTPSEGDYSKKRLTTTNVAEDSDSGSDWENFAEQRSGFNADSKRQMTESLWKEINNVVPVKISASWKNAVLYFIYVDTANGSLLCPLKVNLEDFPFLNEMRRACHAIHDLLQSTKNVRRQLLEPNTGTIGLLPVKEHGITIEIRNSKYQQALFENDVKTKFVVVGRLFHSPTKEVYVCHRPEVPQNTVEMAFRLSFFSVG